MKDAMKYLQPNDWEEIRKLIDEQVRRSPHSTYWPSVVTRYTRTQDVCLPVFAWKPKPKRRKKAEKQRKGRKAK